MNDPAPAFVTYFHSIIPDLVADESIFDNVTFSSLGKNIILEAPYAIVTYEASEQQEFSQFWDTTMLIQFYHQRPVTPDYESPALEDQELLECQSLESGAKLLQAIGEWFGDGPKCCYGHWMTKIGRGSNIPQTGIIGEDNTFLHETRFSVISQYHPSEGS